MNAKRLIPFVAGAVLVFACTRAVPEGTEQAQTAETAEMHEAVASTHGMPPSPGVYVYSDAFVPIEAGDRALLMPTNADRGFGFSKPAGTRFASGMTEFSILGDMLHASQLQVTRFQGVATAAAEPFARVDNTNTAWIPLKSMPAKLREIDADGAFSELSLDAPLEPGFYVLHDETLFRAQVAEDVTGFYPFIITENDKAAWQSDAETCFGELHKAHGDVMGSPLEASKANPETLKRCVSALRLFWKSGDAGRDIEKQLVYLGRLANPRSNDTHQKMLGMMSESQNDLASDLWKIEQSDHMYRLASLYASERNTALEGVLAYYGQPVKGALRNLVWLPFSVLAHGEDPAIASLFAKIVAQEDYTKLLVVLLGAIHYDRVHRSVLSHVHLNSWFKKFDAVSPAAFKTAAAALKFSERVEDVIIGPFQFQNVPEAEHSAWRAAVSARTEDIRKCITRGDAPHGALLIVDQPLNGTGFGREITGSIREVGNEDHKLASISQSSATCILRVFGKLPSEPALDSSRHLKVAIAIRE
ncbi:MAG: hypothetical protein IKY83_12250 [Proteobacteria bacterium]|nr:hypothetical protein [Pseudomonadota bacterium]